MGENGRSGGEAISIDDVVDTRSKSMRALTQREGCLYAIHPVKFHLNCIGMPHIFDSAEKTDGTAGIPPPSQLY